MKISTYSRARVCVTVEPKPSALEVKTLLVEGVVPIVPMNKWLRVAFVEGVVAAWVVVEEAAEGAVRLVVLES